MNAQRVIADLRELAARTSTHDGAQRLAWGPVWRDAREWFKGKVAETGLRVETDSAGNNWVTLRGAVSKTVIVGSHLDSVPNGGWLDGALGVMAGLEVLRIHAAATPPVTLALVDWADEEGARFGRSLLGSSAAAGSLNVNDVRALTDRHGTRLVDALAENGVALERMLDAHRELKAIDARAYLELHIEQGPVLESMPKTNVPCTTPLRSCFDPSTGPCSMCSSRYARASIAFSSRCASSMRSSATPFSASASTSVVPCRSVSSRTSSTFKLPAAAADPSRLRPNRAPSSSAQSTRVSVTGGVAAAWLRSASRAVTTPRQPSSQPPLGTESRWLPIITV